ncbi:MAG: TldD/PmbA family protein [Bacteroidia bacterium]|nr:TldD/PmbA family protein [Bacteroidia bacterium]
MTNKFSHYLRSKKKLIRVLIDQLGVKYPYVSVLGTDTSGSTITVDRSTANVSPSGLTESGFVIKVFNGRGYSELSTNEITKKNIPALIAEIDRLASFKTSIPVVDVKALKEQPLTRRFIRKNKGKSYTTEEVIGILRNYVAETLASSKLAINVIASVETSEVSKMFMSKNKDLEQYYTWDNPRCYVLVRKDGNTKYGYDGYGSNSLEQGLAKMSSVLKETLELAIALLESVTPVPGYYDVITDPSITGLIAHEAFGHGVEMDMFVRDRARSQGYMNKYVASPLITMHDGAAATYSVASYFFDDDGVLAQDTKIIDKGVLVSGISDALSALQLGKTPTGNGRRESYKRKAYTRMTNTFFEPGKSKLEDMIKSIKHGYLIAQTDNGMEDPKNWGIQCTARYGKEIVDGKLTGKIISPVVMSGYVIDLLNSISAVSKDFEVSGSGSCGKGYKEWVRVSDGGPYLKAKVKIG